MKKTSRLSLIAVLVGVAVSSTFAHAWSLGRFIQHTVQTGADIGSFGITARERDRRKAEEDERAAKAALAAKIAEKKQVKKGLVAQRRQAQTELKNWTDVQILTAQSAQQQSELLDLATAVTAGQIQTTDGLGQAQLSAEDADSALKMFEILINAAPADDKDVAADAKAWDWTIQQMSAQNALNSVEATMLYLRKAVEAANADRLNRFMQVVGGMRAQLMGVDTLVQTNIDRENQTLVQLNAQIAALDKEIVTLVTPPAPPKVQMVCIDDVLKVGCKYPKGHSNPLWWKGGRDRNESVDIDVDSNQRNDY
jgi:hypothetical protein